MKRFRLIQFDFDARMDHLDPAEDHWEEEHKKNHERNRQLIIKELISEYGSLDSDSKIARFKEIGKRHASIVAFHNEFLIQARDAYITGAFFPALTAACSLGERLLNHMILTLRDSYKSTPEYKKIYSKDSFDDWGKVIRILSSWNVLQHDAEKEFKSLMDLRHRSLHFNYETESNVKLEALEGVRLIQEIVRKQFCYESFTDWIFVVSGEIYIKKEAEHIPFVRKIVALYSGKIGPHHEIQWTQNRVVDDFDYGNGSLTDGGYYLARMSCR